MSKLIRLLIIPMMIIGITGVAISMPGSVAQAAGGPPSVVNVPASALNPSVLMIPGADWKSPSKGQPMTLMAMVRLQRTPGTLGMVRLLKLELFPILMPSRPDILHWQYRRFVRCHTDRDRYRR